MKDILDYLIKSLTDGNIIIVILIVAVALIFNLKKIIEFFDSRKKVRIIKLNEALLCEYLDDATIQHLQNELAKEYCKLTTGIGLEREFREEVFKVHEKMNGEIGFSHFKRALPYFRFEQKQLSIEISRFEKIGSWLNLIGGYSIAFIGVVTMLLAGQIPSPTFVKIIIILGMGVFFIIVGMFMLAQTFPINSAKIIDKKMKAETNDL